MKKHIAIATVVSLCAVLSACGSSAAQRAAESKSASTSMNGGGYPVQVKSCDQTLTFDKAPKRVLVLSETDISIIWNLGLMDRIVARAGKEKKMDFYPEMREAINKINTIEAGNTGTGGAKVSTESVLEINPDLVIGYDTGVDREALAAAGVPLYSPDAFCPKAQLPQASWKLVDNEIDKLATIFGVQEKGNELKARLAQEIDNLGSSNKGQGKTAVALYITPGSTTFYAYGNTSMVQSIFEANGLTNVYADNSTRVFDESMEDLLAKNPDYIVLLSEDGDANKAISTFKTFAGVNGLKAMESNHVEYLSFILTDPPTDLSVKGATVLGGLLNK